MSGCSQGGAKFPTGGKQVYPVSPRAAPLFGVTSRSGEIPEPTVIVRMKENVRFLAWGNLRFDRSLSPWVTCQ